MFRARQFLPGLPRRVSGGRYFPDYEQSLRQSASLPLNPEPTSPPASLQLFAKPLPSAMATGLQNDSYMQKSKLVQRSIVEPSNASVAVGLDRGGGNDIPIVLIPWAPCCFHCCMEVGRAGRAVCPPPPPPPPPARARSAPVAGLCLSPRPTNLVPSFISRPAAHSPHCRARASPQVPTGSHVLWEKFDKSRGAWKRLTRRPILDGTCEERFAARRRRFRPPRGLPSAAPHRPPPTAPPPTSRVEPPLTPPFSCPPSTPHFSFPSDDLGYHAGLKLFIPAWTKISHIVSAQTISYSAPARGVPTADNILVDLNVVIQVGVGGWGCVG